MNGTRITCEYCGYKSKETEILDMVCPACCTNIVTGKVVENAIPTVFHKETLFDRARIKNMDVSPEPTQTLVWTTKDDRQIPIKKMATQHIKNTLNMLRNKGYVGIGTLKFYLTCPPPTAEGALDAFTQELDKVIDAEPTEYIDLFEAELKRRGEKIY